MSGQIAYVIGVMLRFYTYLIIVYVLMTWFPMRGLMLDINRVIGSLVEPYLGLFRRFIPPIGAVDISPIVAILVLNLLGSFIVRL